MAVLEQVLRRMASLGVKRGGGSRDIIRTSGYLVNAYFRLVSSSACRASPTEQVTFPQTICPPPPCTTSAKLGASLNYTLSAMNSQQLCGS